MSTVSSEAAIRSHVLESPAARITVLSLGCILRDWRVPVAGGWRPVVLGYPRAGAYATDGHFMGQIVGRVANRIAGAQFALNGRTFRLPANDGPHCLHGGPKGIGWQIWAMEPDGARAVRLTLHSPDGDQGFPGAVDFAVTIALDGARLTFDMEGRPDRPTPVSLAQNCYVNLAGRGPVDGHRLRLAAARFTPAGPDMIPTGDIRPVAGTACDFRAARVLGDAPRDVNLVLDGDDGPAAELSAAGLRLRLWTDAPGLQLYTGDGLGPPFAPRAGLCLEPQGLPNAVNTPGFPPILCTPDAPYRQTTTIEIAEAA